MTYLENRQRIKNEAINAIAKIYHPLNINRSGRGFPYSSYEADGSYSEQRDLEVNRIVDEMNKKLKALKNERKVKAIQPE